MGIGPNLPRSSPAGSMRAADRSGPPARRASLGRRRAAPSRTSATPAVRKPSNRRAPRRSTPRTSRSRRRRSARRIPRQNRLRCAGCSWLRDVELAGLHAGATGADLRHSCQTVRPSVCNGPLYCGGPSQSQSPWNPQRGWATAGAAVTNAPNARAAAAAANSARLMFARLMSLVLSAMGRDVTVVHRRPRVSRRCHNSCKTHRADASDCKILVWTDTHRVALQPKRFLVIEANPRGRPRT